MAKVRMNVLMRESLTEFLETFLPDLCKKEYVAAEAAYNKAKKLVLFDRLKKFPTEDMLILKKYDMVYEELHISGADPEGKRLTFSLHHDDPDMPFKPAKYRDITHPFKQKTSNAIEEYDLLKNVYDKAVKQNRADFDALIASYRYVEDVIEVWPASSKVLNDYLMAAGRNLPVALPESALSRIKQLNIGA